MSALRLLWLDVRAAVDWRWVAIIAISILVMWVLLGGGARATVCLQARRDLTDAQRTLIAERDRPAHELADLRAQAASASNRVEIFCGKPQLPDR